MTVSLRRTLKHVLLITTAMGAMPLAAQTLAPPNDGGDVETVIVTSDR
jgi:hypothetical protein